MFKGDKMENHFYSSSVELAEVGHGRCAVFELIFNKSKLTISHFHIREQGTILHLSIRCLL